MSLQLFNGKYSQFISLIWKKISSKELHFIDVVIICITTFSLMVLRLTTGDDIWLLLWRWALMLPLMYITALISNNYESYNQKFTYAYLIITSSLPFDDKYKALKRHVGTITSAWSKYWNEFQTIVNGNNDPMTKTKRVMDLLERITNGGISLPKIVYISIYSFYNIVICSNLMNVSGPYDVMINFVFITILRYWGSDMKGLADLLNDFFIALQPEKTDLEREQAFIELGQKMKDGCYANFILDDERQKQESNVFLKDWRGSYTELEVHRNGVKQLIADTKENLPKMEKELEQLEKEIQEKKSIN